MHVDLALQAVETAAVLSGVVFGLIQLRQLRLQREIEAGIEVLRPLQAPQMAATVMAVYSLPEGLDGAQLQERLGSSFPAVMHVLATLESLGPLIARGHVPVEMYADSNRGVTVLLWKKIEPYIDDQRAHGWPNLYEWVQWLAEQMEARSDLASNVPAFERFKAWKSPADYKKLCSER